MNLVIEPIPLIVALVTSAVAGFTDVWRFKVYNNLTLPVFLCGIAYHSIVNGWSGLGLSLGGVAFALVVLLVPYFMGGLGAGDVKFVMAIGAWIGMGPLVPMIMFGCFAVLIYGIVLAWRTKGLRNTWVNFQVMLLRFSTLGRSLVGNDKSENIYDWTDHAERRRRLIPFSAMMAVGLVTALAVAYVMAVNK